MVESSASTIAQARAACVQRSEVLYAQPGKALSPVQSKSAAPVSTETEKEKLETGAEMRDVRPVTANWRWQPGCLAATEITARPVAFRTRLATGVAMLLKSRAKVIGEDDGRVKFR
jgi:hypothetical protein